MLHFKKTGAGTKSIVFIHGNSQSSDSWNAILSNPILSKSYTLFALDLAGHGKSFRSNDAYTDYSVKGHALHVGDFIMKHISSDYILVGNSIGTCIIGELAPSLSNCKGIILTGAALLGRGLPVSEIIKPNPNMAISFTPDYTEEQLDALIDDAGYNLAVSSKEMIKSDFKNADPNVRLSVAEWVTKNDFSDQFLNIEQTGLPVAVVYGKMEKVCDASCFSKIEFPKWKDEVIFIEESGHCCQMDQPGKLSQIILDFCNEVFGK